MRDGPALMQLLTWQGYMDPGPAFPEGSQGCSGPWTTPSLARSRVVSMNVEKGTEPMLAGRDAHAQLS